MKKDIKSHYITKACPGCKSPISTKIEVSGDAYYIKQELICPHCHSNVLFEIFQEKKTVFRLTKISMVIVFLICSSVVIYQLIKVSTNIEAMNDMMIKWSIYLH